jgi:hypothetical protein
MAVAYVLMHLLIPVNLLLCLFDTQILLPTLVSIGAILSIDGLIFLKGAAVVDRRDLLIWFPVSVIFRFLFLAPLVVAAKFVPIHWKDRKYAFGQLQSQAGGPTPSEQPARRKPIGDRAT